jgi:hypothetical protein
MTFVLRDGISGQELWSLGPTKQEQEDAETITALRYLSADLLVVGTSGGFGVVDLSARRVLRKQAAPDGAAALAVSPDGKRCATGGHTGVILEWMLDPK